MWVRVPPPAPRRSKLYIACSDLFYKSERAHAAAPPFQIEPAALGFDLGLFLSFAVSILCRRRHYVGVIFCIACSDLFYKSERAHAAAPPFQIEPAALGFDLGFFLSFAVSILCRRRRYVGVIFCIACSDLFHKSERAHAAAPPFQIEPAALGFDLGLFLSFAVSILCRRRHYVGVIFCIACSDLFYKSERAHAAAPPFQIEPAALGFDLGFFFLLPYRFCVAVGTMSE